MSDKAKRPPVVEGVTYKTKMPECGTLFVSVNLPLEVISRMGKSGGCTTAWIEAVGRLISLALQWGAPIEEIAEQLKGIRCEKSQPPKGGPGRSVLSCPDAIARNIEETLQPQLENLLIDGQKGDKNVSRSNIPH